MADKLKELVEKRAELWNQNNAILDKAKADGGRELTTDESAEYDAREKDLDAVDQQVEAIQRHNARVDRHKAMGDRLSQRRGEPADTRVEASGQSPITPRNQRSKAVTSERRASAEYADAFEASLKRGLHGLSPQFSSVLQVDQDTTGGFISTSERFVAELIKGIDDATEIRQHCRVFQADYGEDLGFPTLTGDVGDFAFAGEVSPASEDTGMTFGKRAFKVHPLERKLIKASKRLLEGRLMNAESIILDRVNYALNRTAEKKYLLGTGANQPLGMFVASNDGIPTSRDVSTDNTTTTVTFDGLINAEGALKGQYRKNARWVFHRDLLKMIRKLKTGDGAYLWQPSMIASQPNTILNYPYIVSEYAPNTYTTGLYAAILGDLQWYYIADAFGSMAVQVLDQPYATEGVNGYLFDKIAMDAMPVLSEAFVRVKLA